VPVSPRELANENIQTAKTGELPPDEVIYGQSATMAGLRRKIARVADTDVPLLIQGENGTGKEVLARLIHARSVWNKGSFIKVNCAAIPGTLLESELFGYEAGAFTGANSAKPGRIELADGGTLFLDEIGDLDLGVQAKLLQFLQDGKFYPIGGCEEKRVEARIICATNRELQTEIESGKFRMDLFYRINVIHMTLPPLCDRAEDIPILLRYFLLNFAGKFRQPTPEIPAEKIRTLQRCSWPGNIRELENCMARCVVLGVDEALQSYLGARGPGGSSTQVKTAEAPPATLKRVAERARHELERDIILKTLEAHNWNRRRAAETLKISYRTLLYKVRQAGISSMRQHRSFSAKPDSGAIARASAD
jgi:two-component system, NtrC family, response regulator AtoC